MSNELPQGLIDLTSTGKPISKKAYKLVSILFTGKCSKGRIKRMRREKYKSLGWCKVKTFRFIASPVLVLELTLKLIPITRWNRH